jgi:hypothetical protein
MHPPWHISVAKGWITKHKDNKLVISLTRERVDNARQFKATQNVDPGSPDD